MRLVAVSLLVVLLLGTFAASAAPIILHRQSFQTGWFADRFTTTDDRVRVNYEIRGPSSFLSQTIHLYDGTGRLLRERSDFYVSGNPGDLALGAGDARAQSDDVVTSGTISVNSNIHFLCNAACNPSREFIVVVTGTGQNMTAFGYALSQDNFVLRGSTNGTQAHVASSRTFDSTTALVSATALGEGIVIAQGSRLEAHADAAFLGVIFKASPTPAQRMTIEGPSAPPTCTDRAGAAPSRTCIIGKGAPGDYTFRLDDVDARGDETFVSWADVQFP